MAGSTGDTGATGPTGASMTGPPGATGLAGLIGATGATGDQGIQGIQGAQGIQGDAGAQGIQGDVGATGAQGAQGDIGVTGAQGIQGIQGEMGNTGPQGIQGLQGEAGVTGEAGATGEGSSLIVLNEFTKTPENGDTVVLSAFAEDNFLIDRAHAFTSVGEVDYTLTIGGGSSVVGIDNVSATTATQPTERLATGNNQVTVGNSVSVSLVGASGPPQEFAITVKGTRTPPLEKLPAESIFWCTFDNEEINRVDIDGTSNPASWSASGDNPTGIRVDEQTQKVYWTVQTASPDLIEFSNLDGTSITDTTVTPSNPFDVEVDGVRIFWTEYTADDVESADKLDGANPVQLDGNLNTARGIRLDRKSGKLFVCADDTATGLLTYNRDGTDKTLFFTLPNSGRCLGIDLDVDAEHVYYSDRINLEIRRVDFDGTGDTLILDLTTVHATPSGQQLVIDVAGDKIYWTDSVNDFIGRCDLDGGNASQFITMTPAVDGAPHGIDLLFPAGSYYATPNR